MMDETRFYVLESEAIGGPYETSYEKTDPSYGDWPRCPVCGGLLGSREWLPPFVVKLRLFGRECGDLCFGSPNEFLVSDRLADAFREQGLTGLSGFEVVEVIGAKKARKKAPPQYLHAVIARGRAAVDEARSRIKRTKPITCDECRLTGVDAVSGFCFEEGSWSGEDIFFARGIYDVIVTERFRDLVERHGFTNAQFTPIEEYVWDPYAPITPKPSSSQPRTGSSGTSLASGLSRLRVVGLHRLPFDPAAFAEDVKNANAESPEDEAEWAAQYRENWDNAWLVVVSCDGTDEHIDINSFSYGPSPGDSHNQAPWMEEVLDSVPGQTTVGFYLHYVESANHLWYGDLRLDLPPATPAAPELLERVPYQSPD